MLRRFDQPPVKGNVLMCAATSPALPLGADVNRRDGAEVRCRRGQRISRCRMHREIAPFGKLLAARSGHAVAGRATVAGHRKEIRRPETRHFGFVKREVSHSFHPIGVLLCALFGLKGDKGDAVHQAHKIGLHKFATLHPILACHAEVVIPDVREIHQLQRAVMAFNRQRHSIT